MNWFNKYRAALKERREAYEPHISRADWKLSYKAFENVIGLDNVVLRRPSMHEEQSSVWGYPRIP